MDIAEAFLKAMFNKWIDKKWAVMIRQRNDVYVIWIYLRHHYSALSDHDFPDYTYNGRSFICNVVVDRDNGTCGLEKRTYDVMSQMDEFWRIHLKMYAKKEFKRRRTLPVFI